MKRQHFRSAMQILAFVALLLLTEQAVPYLYRMLPSDLKEWDRVTKRQEAIRTMGDQDVLILGDSTGVQGIIPALFQNITGLKTYNLATYADRVSMADLALLEEYLDHHAPPKAIIDVRSFLSWDMGYGFELLRQQFNRTDVAKKLLALNLISGPEYTQLLLEKLLPSLNYREKTAFIRRAFSDKQGYQENLYKMQEGVEWGGYEPFNPAAHAQNIALTEKNLSPFYRILDGSGSLKHTPYSLPLLRELCETANAHGTHFYLTFNPSSDVIRTNPLVAKMVEQVYASVQNTLSDHPDCTLLEKVWVMDNQYLSDLTHTNHSGAILFTKSIADEFLSVEHMPVK